jgi:6-pyruvoyltetrahydropterin/6-carboxytetrahydropterin synthase
VIFFWAQEILKQTQMQNGESDVSVYSVIAHETATGYAQCFADDVANEQMGKLNLEAFEFSDQVSSEWHDPELYAKLIRGENFVNPSVTMQVQTQVQAGNSDV